MLVTDCAEKRPSYRCDEVVKGMIDQMFPPIKELIYHRKELSTELEQRLKDDLKEAILYVHNLDGYALARELERESDWDGIDAAVVEELDMANGCHHVVYRQVMMEWVKRNKLEPRFQSGVRVYLDYEGKKYEGLIFHVYPETLQYVVRVAALGHGIHGSTTEGLIYSDEELCQVDTTQQMVARA